MHRWLYPLILCFGIGCSNEISNGSDTDDAQSAPDDADNNDGATLDADGSDASVISCSADDDVCGMDDYLVDCGLDGQCFGRGCCCPISRQCRAGSFPVCCPAGKTCVNTTSAKCI